MPRGIYNRKKKDPTLFPMVPDPVYLEVLMPPEGIVLKLLSNRNSVFGTVVMTNEGISFMPNKSKRVNKPIAWSIVTCLGDAGLVIPTRG